MADMINHPEHYKTDGIECIQAMEITQGREAVKNFCLCNVFKYLWRHKTKNGLEDLRKAKWYLERYIGMQAYDESKIRSEVERICKGDGE